MFARALSFALVLVSQVASASPAAEKLFQDGRAALASNQLDAACDAFRRSNELEPRVGTLLNLGDCEERRARVATAWEAFVEAKALADKHRDAGPAREAEKRANALAARLPYVLLAVPVRTAQLVITRDGAAVPPAEWDHEVPLDAGSYALAASAPGYVPWSARIEIAEAQHLRVEVPELALAAVEASPAPPGLGVPPGPQRDATPPPPFRHLDHHVGLGLFTGLSSDGDWINGARVVLNAAPLGPGWLRVVPSFAYTSPTDPADPYRLSKLYAIGGTLEYAYPITEQLLAAGGFGFGVDILDDNYGNEAKNEWGALRLSPTFRFDRLDIALHWQLVRTSDRFVSLFEAGLDFFVW